MTTQKPTWAWTTGIIRRLRRIEIDKPQRLHLNRWNGKRHIFWFGIIAKRCYENSDKASAHPVMWVAAMVEGYFANAQRKLWTQRLKLFVIVVYGCLHVCTLRVCVLKGKIELAALQETSHVQRTLWWTNMVKWCKQCRKAQITLLTYDGYRVQGTMEGICFRPNGTLAQSIFKIWCSYSQ